MLFICLPPLFLDHDEWLKHSGEFRRAHAVLLAVLGILQPMFELAITPCSCKKHHHGQTMSTDTRQHLPVVKDDPVLTARSSQDFPAADHDPLLLAGGSERFYSKFCWFCFNLLSHVSKRKCYVAFLCTTPLGRYLCIAPL